MIRHTLLLIMIVISHLSQVQAEENAFTPSIKYGKPSKEELTLTTYIPDTTANAIVLYRTGKTTYQYINDDFSITTQHSVKIKILKDQGKQYADVTLPYYSPIEQQSGHENIFDIEGCSYILEGDKTVKRSLKSEFISRERINDKYMQVKFSIPAVHAGSIIEYRYKQSSDFYVQLDDWIIIEEIPVLYNEYEILIPNIFVFNMELQGKEWMEIKEKEGAYNIQQSFDSGKASQDLTLKARQITFTTRNLPALPDDEAYLWCADDSKIRVSFELLGIVNGDEMKSYTQTWEDIDKHLLKEDSEGFGKCLLIDNPFSESMRTISFKDETIEQRIQTVFRLLKQKMTWNGEYRLYSADLKKAINNKNGSNAELNFILIRMLRDAGILACPVALSLRSAGKLPVHYPSMQKLTTFIVGIHLGEGRFTYLDGSMKDAYLNALPEELVVEKARFITSMELPDKWVNLTELISNSIHTTINVTLTPEHRLNGFRKSTFTGRPAIDNIRFFHQPQDSIALIEKYESRYNCKINNFKQEKSDPIASTLVETFYFDRAADAENEGRIYINPMIFMHISQNPFTQTNRMMPIDLPDTYVYSQTVNIVLPEGYQIEEIPQNQMFVTEQKGISCRYIIQKNESQMVLKYQFTVKQLHFTFQEYPDLQALWTAAAEKNNSLIVIKKP